MFELYFDEIIKGFNNGEFNSIADVEERYSVELSEEEIEKINVTLLNLGDDCWD